MKALIDNTSFAGVMRLVCPDMPIHKSFNGSYPEHRLVDAQSFADFLTALIIYDKILLDSSSIQDKDKSKRVVYSPDGATEASSSSWIEQLVQHLPRDVGELISTHDFKGEATISEEDACKQAFDVFTSDLIDSVEPGNGAKIPNVYFSDEYIYRERFVALNNGCSPESRLDKEALVRAMFLHRGIFLQSRAQKEKMVYMPYHYRGQMLSRLPPAISQPLISDGLRKSRIPLARGERPGEDEYGRAFNKYYYELLKSVTWKTYDFGIPFIGSSVLAAAGSNPDVALKKAMELRSNGSLRDRFSEMRLAIEDVDRPRFESLFEDCKQQLDAAANQLGTTSGDLRNVKLCAMVVSWLPINVAGTIETVASLLPVSARTHGRRIANTIVKKSALQQLFIEHVKAIRDSD
ncbi:MAG: hypothetical protein GKS03_00195 [Alphaproteobacteria bacterium]|nr:hypothetical protein [Alphaproteobacteria bacterium]